MKRTLRCLIALMALILMAPTAAARADGIVPTPDEDAIRSFYSSYGVSAAVQDDVIAGLRAGVVPLSDAGGDPVRTKVVSRTSEEVVTLLTYADGSIAVSTVSNMAVKKAAAGSGGVTPMSVTSCTQTSNSFAIYYKNCIAKHKTTLLTIAFRFNYENIRGSGANISWWCCEEHSAIGGSYSGRFTKINSTTLRYTGTFVYYSGIASVTRWMQVRVSGSSAWTEMN